MHVGGGDTIRRSTSSEHVSDHSRENVTQVLGSPNARREIHAVCQRVDICAALADDVCMTIGGALERQASYSSLMSRAYECECNMT